MTKQDYIVFAAMLKRVRGLPVCTNKNSGAAGRAAVSIIEVQMTQAFMDDNSKFDVDRFRSAAYRGVS